MFKVPEEKIVVSEKNDPVLAWYNAGYGQISHHPILHELYNLVFSPTLVRDGVQVGSKKSATLEGSAEKEVWFEPGKEIQKLLTRINFLFLARLLGSDSFKDKKLFRYILESLDRTKPQENALYAKYSDYLSRADFRSMYREASDSVCCCGGGGGGGLGDGGGGGGGGGGSCDQCGKPYEQPVDVSTFIESSRYVDEKIIQGRMVISLCEALGVDPDLVLNKTHEEFESALSNQLDILLLELVQASRSSSVGPGLFGSRGAAVDDEKRDEEDLDELLELLVEQHS